MFSKQNFITWFLTEFQKNQVLENQVSKKQVLEKPVFVFRKDYYENIVLNYLVLLYDHTLLAQSPRTLFCIYILKEILLEKF